MSEQRYNLAARLIHWIMALGFVFMWGCGYTMTTFVEEDSPAEEFLFDLRISIGVTALALAAGQVAAAFKHLRFDGHAVIRRVTFGGR